MNDATAGGHRHARTLPSHDLKLIDDRRLVYEGALDLGGFHGVSFRTADGMGVVVSIDPAIPAGEGFHLSITRPGHPPSDDDIALVRIAVCGPGSHVRIVTPATSMLRGQIVHLDEEPDRYDPPDAPWWTRAEFAAVAARMAKETGIPATRAQANMEHLQRLGLTRLDPAGTRIVASWCAWTHARSCGATSGGGYAPRRRKGTITVKTTKTTKGGPHEQSKNYRHRQSKRRGR